MKNSQASGSIYSVFFYIISTRTFIYNNLQELAKIQEKSSSQVSDSVWSLFLFVSSVPVVCAQLASFALVDVIFQSEQTMRQAAEIQCFVVLGQSRRKYMQIPTPSRFLVSFV